MLWVQVRLGGGKVATATWPGGDGADIRINNTLVQTAVPTRTVDYTVPFGAFGGVGAVGFDFTGANFTPAPAGLVDQIEAAGRRSLQLRFRSRQRRSKPSSAPRT